MSADCSQWLLLDLNAYISVLDKEKEEEKEASIQALSIVHISFFFCRSNECIAFDMRGEEKGDREKDSNEDKVGIAMVRTICVTLY